MPKLDRHEQKFLNALRDIFVGAKIEGESGYINLMKIKSRYYTEGVFPQLMRDIDAACRPFDAAFREELFDKLHDFFGRYFSESGSIYFRHTAFHHNVYERVYTDDRDVMLFWKTHMLYYVKTDRLFNTMDVAMDGQVFRFDVAGLEHKRANEKRELIYELKGWREGKVVLAVAYSERGRKTKSDDILRELRKKGVAVDDETLARACRVFEKQSEVDYFINKNARAFLREQFDLWLYQYVFSGDTDWKETRLRQLGALKEIAFKIIDFIAQFEDELVRVWNKPKFVLNSHYVITLDKITDESLRGRLFGHTGMAAQLQEWRDLGLVDESFAVADISRVDLTGAPLRPEYRYLPLDTRHFPDLELDILALFDDLDEALDGWLIYSENYQGLNTLGEKFREKVQCIYIDPPFNLDSTDQFNYRTNYKDANWATLLQNRINLGKTLLGDKGLIFVRCDYNGNWIVRPLLSSEFGEQNFYNEIFINRIKKNVTDKGKRNIPAQIDSLFVYRKSHNAEYIDILKKLGKKKAAYWHSMESAGIPGPRQTIIEGRTFYPSKGSHFKFTQGQADEMFAAGRIRINPNTDKPQYLVPEKESVHLDTNWTDIPGYAFLTGFQTENSEILLMRVIEAGSNAGDLVVDFFVGSGTATAVSHKLGRKWIGIELGDHFTTHVVPRMKKVLSGDKSGISKTVNWQGGGFFKYYDLEQYEDTLRRAHYDDAPLLAAADAWGPYAFLRDLRLMKDTVTLDGTADAVNVRLDALYPGIDLAETLSNVTGKGIRRITREAVEFQDGSSASLTEPDWNLLKPLLWW